MTSPRHTCLPATQVPPEGSTLPLQPRPRRASLMSQRAQHGELPVGRAAAGVQGQADLGTFS